MSETDSHVWKFHKELSAGIVSLVLLGVLARSRSPMYGYQIAKQLDQHGEGVLSGKQSALYPVLRNLCAAGLLDSEVEPSVSGPPRCPPGSGCSSPTRASRPAASPRRST